jgi:polyisoprenoid-binding protein YceI
MADVMRTLPVLSLLCGAAVVGVGGWASSSSRAAPAAATAPAWQVQDGSSIGFRTSWSGTGVTGEFKKWTATIKFDPDHLDRSAVTVSVDPASAVSDHSDVDAQLGGESWFNVAKFPQVAFASERFEKIDADNYRATGKLTVKGVSRPLSFPFTLKINGDQASMDAEIGLDRLQLGVGSDSYPDGSSIPAEVSVDVKLTAKKQG